MKHLFILLVCISSYNAFSQHKCISQIRFKQHMDENPSLKMEVEASDRLFNQLQDKELQSHKHDITHGKTNVVITIPVVVHVVWKTASQNISEAQIREQIRVLNEDYRLRNPDSLPVTHPFWPYSADAEYEFCLATTDPAGNPTTGITRTNTTVNGFDADVNGDDVKFTSTGGRDNWDPSRYLNIWVCNLINGTLGYATFPNEILSYPEYDGVVIGYRFFGTGGVTLSPNDGGRTATHEVGHWLGLYHPCDNACSNDFITDTPPCEELSYGCPSFPHNPNNACGADANGEMFMNFMDYVDDACMNTFTYGQTVRMRNSVNTYRSALATANKCVSTVSVQNHNTIKLSVFPNPASNEVQLYFGYEQDLTTYSFDIKDALGKSIYKNTSALSPTMVLDVSKWSAGTYFMHIYSKDGFIVKPFYIIR